MKILLLLLGWAALLLVAAQENPELDHLRLNQIQVRHLSHAVAAHQIRRCSAMKALTDTSIRWSGHCDGQSFPPGCAPIAGKHPDHAAADRSSFVPLMALSQRISIRMSRMHMLRDADPGYTRAAPADAVLSYLDSKSWGLHTLQIPQQFKFDHLTITQQLDQGG